MDGLETPHKKVAIIGAGITGLAAAYYLQQQVQENNLPVALTLIESSSRLGGKIITEQVDGFTVEGGPDCFLSQKPWAFDLAKQIGIHESVIGTNDERRKTFVLDKGRLVPLPEGVMLIIPTKIRPFLFSKLITWPGKIRMGMDWFIPRFRSDDDESVGDFVRRRLGTEALYKIAEPLMSGIHVSDPEKQSLLATFPRFRAMEKNHGSLIRGMLSARKKPAAPQNNNKKKTSIFQSFKGGMGQLVAAIENELTSTNILKNTAVERVESLSDASYRLHLSGTQTIDCDVVVITTPTYVTADMLSSLDSALADSLREISYVSTATVSLAYPRSAFPNNIDGFGFVIPSQEDRRISACTWSSFKFNHRAPQDHILIRCFVGGPCKEDLVLLDDVQMTGMVQEELKSLLGIHSEPLFVKVYRWEKANPQYHVGHIDRVAGIFEQCRKNLPGIVLTGSAYQGVGVPDCVRQGKEAAQNILNEMNIMEESE